MKCASQCLVWLLALSATICAGAPQKHEQASAQKTVSVQDSVSVNVIRADDIPVKAGEPFSFTVTMDRPPNFKGAALLYSIAAPGGNPTLNTGIEIYPNKQEMGIPLTQVSPTSSMRRWWKSIRVT